MPVLKHANVTKRPLAVVAAVIASGLFIAGAAAVMPTFAATEKGSYAKGERSERLIELKLKDDSAIEQQGNKFRGEGSEALNEVLGKYKIEKNSKLFTRDTAALKAEYRELKGQGHDVADLSQYYIVQLPTGTDVDAVVEELKVLPVVEDAYRQALPVEAPATPSFVTNQTHDNAATKGVDSDYANVSWPGGKGERVRLIDLEYAWNHTHEDVTKAASTNLIPNGTPVNPFTGDDHGTASVGVLVAGDNAIGVKGMAPNAALKMVNTNSSAGYTPANAINIAAANMSTGDVMLIEQQTGGPSASTTDYVPLEWIASVYDAIKTATAANKTVVEPAGNGSQNLDDAAQFGSPFPSGKASSGAIIVGGGAHGCGTTPINSRMSYSTYGSRLDVQGVGECVVTTGYGTLFNGGANATYASGFNGTSSSSAVVAGAVGILSSAYEQLNGGAPTQAFIKNALVSTGTPQNTAAGTLTGKVGPLPNLRKALPLTDLTAPTTPTNLTASLVSSKPQLSWTASTDNVGIVKYRIERRQVSNGALTNIDTPTNATTYRDATAVAGVQYSYLVKGVDAANRFSPPSSSRTITSQ